MSTNSCPFCKQPVAASWSKCLHCNKEIPHSQVEKEKQLQKAQAIIKEAYETQSNKIKTISLRDKIMNIILFILSVPLLVPILIWTTVRVKRWGRIPFSYLMIDAFFVIITAYSLKAHWGAEPLPLFVDMFFPATLVAIVAIFILNIIRIKQGASEYGMMLGYSSGVVHGLVWGTLFCLISSLVIIESQAPGVHWYLLFVVGLTLFVLTARTVIYES